jgi:hypothetical protein
MTDLHSIRKEILELTSEGEWGSWDFWSHKERIVETAEMITGVLVDLVNEHKIYALEYDSIADHSYKEVPLDAHRLKKEVKASINPTDIKTHNFYWFLATEEGKKEDLLLRKRD